MAVIQLLGIHDAAPIRDRTNSYAHPHVTCLIEGNAAPTWDTFHAYATQTRLIHMRHDSFKHPYAT